MMLPQEVIRRKRDGHALTREEVKTFIAGLTEGSVSEGQVAAFAMAVFFKGMSREEAVGLTLAMRDSGTILTWDLPGPIVDKHSSGGIGDNVSLVLAPMLAACGFYVPMISGRGLGHTGGTLDKLDAIPGYQSQPDLELFRKTVKEAGCAIIGQTADLAPADKRLYGIRDVTATVESVPLITASILSKKLAAGLGRLILDVKCGSGAFMASREEARTLAESLVKVANGAGLPTSALITDMDEPLASAAGNAVEVKNAIDYLRGDHRDQRLHEIVLALGCELLMGHDQALTKAQATSRLQKTLDDGSAAEHFEKMSAALGGPSDLLDKPEQLRAAKIIRSVYPLGNGMVETINTRALGLAVIELGGGRRIASDGIDHAVGLTHLAGKGALVDGQLPLCFIHANDENSFASAQALIQAAYHVGEDAPRPRPMVLDRIAP